MNTYLDEINICSPKPSAVDDTWCCVSDHDEWPWMLLGDA